MISSSPRITDNLSQFSTLQYTTGALTNGAISQITSSEVRSTLSKYSWTNAMVAGLAGTSGNLKVCTLPAKTRVNKVTIVITGQAGTLTTLTVSCGRTATTYIDYVVAKNAKVASNTIYGQILADIGVGLSALVGDLPSLTTTTDINLQFVSTIENLSNVTGSTGDVYVETTLLS